MCIKGTRGRVAIDTSDRHSTDIIDTRSTCWSIDTWTTLARQGSIVTRTTLARQGSIVGRVATDLCVGRQHPYRDG